MKIQIIKANNMINISFNSNIRQKKNKSFPEGDFIGVLNYALNLPDQFILACSKEVLEWAREHNHAILTRKSWIYA